MKDLIEQLLIVVELTKRDGWIRRSSQLICVKISSLEILPSVLGLNGTATLHVMIEFI